METVRREIAPGRVRIALLIGPLFASAVGAVSLPAVTAAAPGHHAVAAAHARAMPRPAAAAATGAWSASACGREPAAPAVQTDTIARYNASIDAVTAYDQAARAYNSCVSRTATAEQTAISAEARRRIDAIQGVSEAVQKRIAANFVALGAALKKGPPAH